MGQQQGECQERKSTHLSLLHLTASDHWQRNLATGAYYQINKQSVLTWAQADTSCRQQNSALLSVTDPHEQAFVSGKVAPCGRSCVVTEHQIGPEIKKLQ